MVLFFILKIGKIIRQIAKIRLQAKKRKKKLAASYYCRHGRDAEMGLQTLISPPVRLADGRCARASESVSDA